MLVAGYVYAQSESPGTTPEATSAVVASDTEEPSPPQTRWEQRRDDIRSALPPPTTKSDAAQPRGAGLREGYRDLVRVCLDDLETEHVGALTLSIREIGAPDIGTIYESIEVVHTNFGDPDVLECIVQSMYGFVGEPPQEPFERQFTSTMPLGQSTDDSTRQEQLIGYIVGAHMSEVRFCATKAQGDAQGTVTYAMTMGDEDVLVASTPGDTDLPAAVVECITAATKRWKFPKTLAGQSFEQDFVLPVPGSPAGKAKPK